MIDWVRHRQVHFLAVIEAVLAIALWAGADPELVALLMALFAAVLGLVTARKEVVSVDGLRKL